MSLTNFKNADLTINNINTTYIPKQYASEGDYLGRTLTVQITDDGLIGRIDGAQLVLHWKNMASGLSDDSAFTLIDSENAIFRIEYPTNMLTPGTVKANILVIYQGKTTVSREFEITVANVAGQSTGVLAKAEFSALVAALSAANTWESRLSTIEESKADVLDVTDKLSKKADKSFVDAQFATIISGSPKGAYMTLAALQTAYPNGTEGVFLVVENGHWYYYANGWKDGGVYQATEIADGAVTEKKIDKSYREKIILDNQIKPTQINQLLNPSSAIDGKYWSYTGTITQYSSAGMRCYPPIKIKQGSTYWITLCSSFFTYIGYDNGEIIKLNNEDKIEEYEFVASFDGLIYLSISKNKLAWEPQIYDKSKTYTSSKIGLEKARKSQNLAVVYADVTKLNLEGDVIIVDKNGGGQYTKLVDALNDVNAINATSFRQTTIKINEGIYDLYDELGGIEFINKVKTSTSEMQGILLPQFVNLVGVGDVTLQMIVPDDVSTIDTSARISTLNLKYTNRLENLKIISKNTRYAVHDESNNTSHRYKRRVKNCHIIHLGNLTGQWGSPSAYGCGIGSAVDFKFEQTTFSSAHLNGAGFHDNSNQKSSILVFNDCNFESYNDGWGFDLSFATFGSGSDDHYVYLNNCKLSKKILLKEETNGSKTGNRFKLFGGGNTHVAHQYSLSGGKTNAVEFADETRKLKNNHTEKLAKGCAVKIRDHNMLPCAPSESYLFYGILLEDVEVGNFGLVKTSGYVNLDMLNITATMYDKIGILDTGLVGVTTTNDYVGIVNSWGNMLLI